MASSIDATKPTAGAALTADVRNNFSAAKTEIEALQAADATLAPKGAATSSGLTMSAARLLGRTTAGTGAIEEISVAGTLSLTGGVLTGTGGGGASKYQLGAAWSGSGMPLVAAGADRVARTVPATGTIKQCTVLGAGGPGSVVVDIWRNTYAAYPPTAADTIVASSKPTITAAHKSVDSTLTGWSTAVTAGDVLVFVINSASTLTAAQVILDIEL